MATALQSSAATSALVPGRGYAKGEPDRATLQRALDTCGEAVLICSCTTQPPQVVYANASFERLIGYSAAEMYGQAYDSWLAAASPGSSEFLREAVRTARSATATVRLMPRWGAELHIELSATPVRDGLGRTCHFVLALRVLTETQSQIEHLRFIANHDSLTGLPNRRLLLDRLDQAVGRYRRSSESFTLAFVDLNELKLVNDRLGHAAGDELLKHVAQRLAASVRTCDTVARFGGDEFVLLLSGATAAETATQAVARMLLSVDQPLRLGGRSFKPTCSVGIAACPRDGVDAAVLLQAADNAMYRAKATRSGSAVCGFPA